MTAPTVNSLDFLKGCKPALSISKYVPAGGAGAFYPVGNVTGIELDFDETVKEVESDCSLFVQDLFPTKIATGLNGVFHEADLKKLALSMGYLTQTSATKLWDTAADVTVPAQVARSIGATDGTSTLLVGEPPAVKYYQVQLVVDDQSFISGSNFGTPLTDNYTKRTVTIWRATFVPKVKMTPKRDDWVKYGFEMKFMFDSSVATADKLFKVVDFVAK